MNSLGINENVLTRFSKNTKSKQSCRECKDEWNNKIQQQVNSKKFTQTLQQDPVQCISDKFDQLNTMVGIILDEIKQLREQNIPTHVQFYENNNQLETAVYSYLLKTKIEDLDQK